MVLAIVILVFMAYAGYKVHKIIRMTNLYIELVMIMINVTFIFITTIAIKEFLFCF